MGNGRANLGWRREGWEGWEWEGNDIMISLKDIDVVGSGGRVGNGRANAYRLENTTVDKSIMVKGWLGGLGMGGQRHIDLIEDMDSVGSGGRFGNGRANIYILDNMEKYRLEKGGVGGLGMGGQRDMISLKYMDVVGSGGKGWEWEGKCIQIGRYNREWMVKGGGGLGMGGQRHIDLIEYGLEWEGKYIHIRQHGQIVEGMVGRVGNGRAKTY